MSDFLKGILNTDVTHQAQPLTIDAMLKAIDRLWKLDAKPPRASRFYASHSVPYGRVYRMWTTRGEMIAYINRGQVADMPRGELLLPQQYPGSVLYPALTGIPIHYE